MLNLLNRQSFIELGARERARAIADPGSFRELLDPFERCESPHLAAQGIVPQSDDGVVIARATLAGKQAVIVAVECRFLGGGIGETSGAKIAGALELALRDNEAGTATCAALVLDTGGVRLQEGNYGLLAIAEIAAAIVALRRYEPVVGIIAGMLGCFGGMSICAGLCSHVLMTRQGRLQLNGPEVIELEAGAAELDAGDRARIWSISGGEQRAAVGMADLLVDDDLTAIRLAVEACVRQGAPSVNRSAQIDRYLAFLRAAAPSPELDGAAARLIWPASGETKREAAKKQAAVSPAADGGSVRSRGSIWFETLSGTDAERAADAGTPSVLCADGELDGRRARYVTIVPNRANRFHRARNGELGVDEGWTLAKHVRDAVEQDAAGDKRAIVAIVDVPGQAFGYLEELLGLHQACAAAVDAYATARLAGHPVIALLVGPAISGGFLAHGLQANRLVALHDPRVVVQVMSRQSNARITRRSQEELEQAAARFPATAYDIGSFAKLGALFDSIKGVDADAPGEQDKAVVAGALAAALRDIGADDASLGGRLRSPLAAAGREASIRVRERLQAVWN